jgi:multidrug efflux pump subunit AcrB
MSAIGNIVMGGIIINDSIPKIDTITGLELLGYRVLEAVHIAGKRRLKPINMTSLTTVLGLLPSCSPRTRNRIFKNLWLRPYGGMTIGTL